MKLPARTTLSQAVADNLMTLIREKNLAPGDRLPTVLELTEMYGVGRNTVREGLQALVAMGIVEIRPRVGATVRAGGSSAASVLTMSGLLDDGSLRDLYELRAIVEVRAAGLAAQRATEDEIARIAELGARYAFDAEHGLETFRDDVELHEMIAQASHNAFLGKVLADVSGLLHDARRRTDQVDGATAKARHQHVAICEAIAARDAERAMAAMSEHIESAKWALEQVLETSVS